MSDFLLIKGIFVHIEVEQGYRVDVVELEIPFVPLWSLLSDRKGGIEQGTVFEVGLVCILHFHNKLLAIFSFAIYVENGFSIGIDVAHVLWIQIPHILNNLSSIEQAVEEANK